MSDRHLHAVDNPAAPGTGSGNNGGNGFDSRLREAEKDIAGIKNELTHLATKAWVLGGVIGGMIIAASLAITILKLFP